MKLLPCPFCGEELVRLSDHHGSWYGHRNDMGDCQDAVIQIHDQQDADRWNKRSIPLSVGPIWVPVTERKPDSHRLLLVTNNIAARNAFGQMSHVWLVSMLHEPEEDRGAHVYSPDDGFTAYDGGDYLIQNITHWCYLDQVLNAAPQRGRAVRNRARLRDGE